MTALNFFITPDEICFSVDTLSLSADDRRPLSYITKFVLLPHLRVAATGTGNGNFLAEWYTHVRGSMIASDIDHLNEYVPGELRRLAEPHDLSITPATAYHFGYSERRGRFLAYAYRSTSDFASEELLEGIGVKPQVALPAEPHVFPELFIDLMKQQQAEGSGFALGRTHWSRWGSAVCSHAAIRHHRRYDLQVRLVR